ncbi:FHA domain-containing serine/threonine-protein kinase [Anaerolineales bacterium HSG24]|nr:FHA domain-containing serine/threonine-protein kinase [Anaerolineales bacterium HSG24]
MELILKWQSDGHSQMQILSAKEVQHNAVLIGRAQECRLIVADKSVSRRQAELFVKDDCFYLRNISTSNNPIRVNKQKLTQNQTALVEPGAIIQLGDSRIYVEDANEEPTAIKHQATKSQVAPKFTERKLGKYELKELIGKGGMAQVYKAYQPGIDRTVAIKILHSHLTTTPDFVSRFQREAKTMGQLQHPHILRVIDFDTEDNVYYMVMEYVIGDTLFTYLERHEKLSVAETLRLAGQLSDALAYAHAREMIHRDIKPENIIFRDEAHTHTILTDFGLVRLLGDTMTLTGTRIGTPAYMSPEAARGDKADQRADIYGLGILMYELLAGEPPYTGNGTYDIINKVLNDPLPSLQERSPKVPDDLDQLIRKTLAKDPDERYQTANELTEEIRQLRLKYRSERKPSVSMISKPKNPTIKKTNESGLQRNMVIAVVAVLSILVIVALMVTMLSM